MSIQPPVKKPISNPIREVFGVLTLAILSPRVCLAGLSTGDTMTLKHVHILSQRSFIFRLKLQRRVPRNAQLTGGPYPRPISGKVLVDNLDYLTQGLTEEDFRELERISREQRRGR